MKENAVIKNCHLNQFVMLNLFQHLLIKRFRAMQTGSQVSPKAQLFPLSTKFGMTFGRGFTLAEVLITLTIIGVIAALTIPNLMRKWEDHHTVAAVKEAYAIVDNAFRFAVQENGPLLDWDWPNKKEVYDMANYRYMAETIKPYLKVQKYCPSTINVNEYKNCIPVNKDYISDFNTHGWHYYSYLNNTRDTGSLLDKYDGYMLLSNGMSVTFQPIYLASGCAHSGALSDYIGQLLIDINGKKGPNRFGYDLFRFTFNQTGLFIKYHRENPGCSYENGSSGCSNSQSKGTTCGAWVIKHGNMDYKYRDVSADW